MKMRFECLEVITSAQKLVYTHIACSVVVPACRRPFVPSLEVKVFESRIKRSERYNFISAAERLVKRGGSLNLEHTCVSLLVNLDRSNYSFSRCLL